MQNSIFTIHQQTSYTHDALLATLEEGKVLYFPQSDFVLTAAEKTLLEPRLADPKIKNISFDARKNELKGTATAEKRPAIQAFIARYVHFSQQLIATWLPFYQNQATFGLTSLRLHQVQQRHSSWRKDDSRLHIDAFPSRPNQGTRILRIFTNIHGHEARVWRVGEPFAQMSGRLLNRIPRQWPGTASLLKWCGITKSYRSAYDHIMLHLHDKLKADVHYQARSPQETVSFAPGSTWICFSDQTLHAAMSGQFMLEQTVWLPVHHMKTPEKSPLKILEQQAKRALV
jgi:hypothetical protein